MINRKNCLREKKIKKRDYGRNKAKKKKKNKEQKIKSKKYGKVWKTTQK